jgi:hypothetical protein
MDWVFATLFLLKTKLLHRQQTQAVSSGHMRRTVDKLPIQPILHPCGVFILIIDDAFLFLKERDDPFRLLVVVTSAIKQLLIRADVLVFAGIVTVKVCG